MVVVIDVEPIRERFLTVAPFLDERGRRLVAAAEAFAAGYGGIAAVAMATGMAPSTIGRGLKELAQDEPSERVRRPGAGRKPAICKDPTLLADLEALVEPTTRGDPESPLRWTCRSVRRLAQALQAQGHEVSRTLVAELLNAAGYSLQANRKTKEGDSHPDRDAQFARINSQVAAALAEKQPVISVDTKKKELVGDFRNNGREYRPQGNPEAVRVHDFLIKELGRAVPYGVYDLAANSGWVSVGVDHDTAAFAVNSIRQWWQAVGRARYPEATRLLITADGGGSNGSRVRLWKRELQKLANELGLDIVVSHLPPGTSKWNKIEHRLFSFISQNWRAKPLVSYRVIVELISATTTKTGLTVRCELDTGQYPSGIVVSDAEMAAINIKRATPPEGTEREDIDGVEPRVRCACRGADGDDGMRYCTREPPPQPDITRIKRSSTTRRRDADRARPSHAA
jgi:Rhodopirellula transposase DDE domain